MSYEIPEQDIPRDSLDINEMVVDSPKLQKDFNMAYNNLAKRLIKGENKGSF